MKQHAAIDWNSVRDRLHAGERLLENALHPSEERIREVHDRRARHLAGRRATTVVEQPRTVLVFQIGADRYALDLTCVVEVGPLRRCTPVPGASAVLCGVISHRGEVRSVVDLGRLMGRAIGESPASGFFVRVRSGEQEAFLRVDGVEQILRFPADQLQGADQSGLGPSDDHVIGVHRDGFVILGAAALLGKLVRERPVTAPLKTLAVQA